MGTKSMIFAGDGRTDGRMEPVPVYGINEGVSRHRGSLTWKMTS